MAETASAATPAPDGRSDHSMTIFVGIDPGKQGAIAWISMSPSRPVTGIRPTPLIRAKQGKDQYDLVAICKLFQMPAADRVIRELFFDSADDQVFVTVEESRSIPANIKAGSLAQFNRGVSTGWLWMLTALLIPHQVVSPKNWQKVMLAGTPGKDTKQRSIMAAQRLFPDVSLKRTGRAKKDDDGFSDALLLAEYGRRTYVAHTLELNGATGEVHEVAR